MTWGGLHSPWQSVNILWCLFNKLLRRCSSRSQWLTAVCTMTHNTLSHTHSFRTIRWAVWGSAGTDPFYRQLVFLNDCVTSVYNVLYPDVAASADHVPELLFCPRSGAQTLDDRTGRFRNHNLLTGRRNLMEGTNYVCQDKRHKISRWQLIHDLLEWTFPTFSQLIGTEV